MLNDIAVDVGLQAHNEILRARSICDICNTRCVLSVFLGFWTYCHRCGSGLSLASPQSSTSNASLRSAYSISRSGGPYFTPGDPVWIPVQGCERYKHTDA